VWLPIAAWIPLFFRDPVRTGPRDDRLVLAPADGRVVSVTEVQEPDVIQGPATRIAIFMNVFNVHVNRHPVDGTVVHRTYRPGKFFNASLDKASADNEQMSLGIATARGPVLVRQIAGLIARRIVTDPAVGERVQQGARLGLIRFGSRVEAYLPPGAVARVAIGERTRAGVTVIAAWP
jgi:phosphatidylserine decarboxylase